MTTSAFPALTTAEQIFYDLIWTPMIKAGEVWLAGVEATVPVLDVGIVQGLEDDVIQAVTDYTFNLLKTFIDIESIALVNAAHQSAYASASLQLKVVAQESGINSDAYIQARNAALANLAQFTHFNGT